MSDEVANAILGELRAIREELRGRSDKRIDPSAVYSVDEAITLVPMSAYTLREKLRCGVIEGTRSGTRAPWYVRGSELLKLGGRAA